MEVNDGGNAFPIPGLHHDADFNGLTMRDYFAAKAMAVVWADIPEEAARNQALNQLGIFAYEMADAMLKARQGASDD